jgi:serine/threonine protein kinase
VRYFTEMVSAVGYLHEQGVVHRDLKLENVLLSGANTCKLCDFGLAHAYDLDPSGAIVRMPLKEVCGSKSYCAPEVLAGLGYDGGLADMWSLVRPTPLHATRPMPHAPPHPALRPALRPSMG